MSTRTWHKGPPPFPGWWNASWDRDDFVWRFHDGNDWSLPAKEDDSASIAVAMANHYDTYGHAIEWTDYWPENARVPRVDPRSKT